MVSESGGGRERRRGLRVDGSFLVQVLGLDDTAELRQGNISLTGIYFETEAAAYAPGLLERLAIAGPDRTIRFEVLATVVRLVTIEDLWDTGRMGVAFEFLLQDEATGVAVQRLLNQTVQLRLGAGHDPPLGAGLAIAASSAAGAAVTADIRGVRAGALVLESSWAVEQGARLHLEVRASSTGSHLRLDGDVRRIERVDGSGERYRIEVAVQEAEVGNLNEGVGPLMEGLLAKSLRKSVVRSSVHLDGALSRVPLTSLFAFMEYESMSGSVRLEGQFGKATIYVREGRIVDVSAAEPDPRRALAFLLKQAEGSFTLHLEPVDRPDRLGGATQQVLAAPGNGT